MELSVACHAVQSVVLIIDGGGVVVVLSYT
jgi:hypothetical protein